MQAGQALSPRAGEPCRVDPVGGLIVAVAQGHQGAFADLYRAQLTTVRATAMTFLHDFHQAEEVAQEVLLQIWQLAHRFDPHRGSGQGWIWQLARSRAVDRVRHAQSVRVRDQQHAALLYVPDFDVVLENILLAQEVEELRNALLQLTVLQREALLLAFATGLTYPQIATQLRIPLATVKTRIRDGLIAMRSTLIPLVDHPVESMA